MLNFALQYATELGWAVFPVHSIVDGACTCPRGPKCPHPGKHPRTKNGLKDASTIPEQISAWWTQWPGANIAVACGDRIVVLDVDPRNGGTESLEALSLAVGGIPETAVAVTGGGGQHLVFSQASTPVRCGNMGPDYPGLDIKGDGGYLVVAPSNHVTGGMYSWIGDGPFDPASLADAPNWLLPVKGAQVNATKIGLITKGHRNDLLFREAVSKWKKGEAEAAIREFLRVRNQDCTPPLEVDELEAIAKSVLTYPQNNAKVSAASILLGLVRSAGVELWRDAQGEPFATIPKNGHFENVRCESAALRGFLWSLGCLEDRRPSSKTLAEVCELLSNQARFEGKDYPRATRVWACKDAVYLFLADEHHRAIEITEGGWRIGAASECPVRFVKSRSALPLPEPRRGGSFEPLRGFLSVDDNGFEFVRAFALSCLMPRGTLPVFIATGEQGSGKSFGCGLIRSIVDPHDPMLRAWTTDLRDMPSAVANNYVLAFDNISRVPEQVADALCRVVAGVGFADRQLYTNSDECVVPARNPVLLNGIGSYATRGDLLDRALVVNFLRIDGTGNRKTEEELSAAFEQSLPGILGGLLDLAVTAMKNRAEAQNCGFEDTRLADLGVWVAASEPLERRGTFSRLLSASKTEANLMSVENDPLAASIRFLVEDSGAVECTLAQLLAKLRQREGFDKDNPSPYGWPKSAGSLGKQLPRIAPALRAIGIGAEQLPRSGSARLWRFFSTEPKKSSQASYLSPVLEHEPNDAFQDGDSNERWHSDLSSEP